MSAVSSGYVPTRADDEARAESRRKLLRRVLMIGGVAVFAVIASAVYLWGGRYISSENGTQAMTCNRTSISGWEAFGVNN